MAAFSQQLHGDGLETSLLPVKFKLALIAKVHVFFTSSLRYFSIIKITSNKINVCTVFYLLDEMLHSVPLTISSTLNTCPVLLCNVE